MIAQHVGRDRQEVVARARADAPAHTLDRGRDLVGGARGGALGQQLGDQRRDPFFAGGIVRGSRAEAETHREGRLLVILDQQQGHPVRQCDIPERRELHGPEATGSRCLGGEGLLGGKME